ncbi:FliC/FljB family flagellin [Citrobacter sp. RHB25-C09]|uniref:FliC/FljB family flagellin n=1 Tax=Citrobacter sp. RHB25-C09 TaxID=2742624 RepID=UPI0015EE85A6|nr:FliC/FljB family flagellin [Citrobacter sp. RHB25-C09]QMI05547.1 FliC/FljB family flagellin [Citrobacter sp. RHB25-C09]
MAQVINTNSLSLLTQNNLNKSQGTLSSAIERLSSGLRINSAKDDAAGQAIANRFTSNIKGLTQASRNANDGISVAQTTEGSLNEINNNLQRIRELSVQAANGSNSDSDLSSIQDEIKQRLSEIDRVSGQTQFNGTKILSKDQTLTIQVGANDGETIDINLQEITSKTLGLDSFNVNGPKGEVTTATTADFEKFYGSTTQVSSASVSEAKTDALATRLGVGTANVAFDSASVYTDEKGNLFAKVSVTASNAAESNNLKANGFEIASGSSASFYVALDPQAADTTTATKAAFTIDTDNLSFKSMTTGATSGALDKIDKALAKVDEFRSSLGAIQNRFESAITNLGNTVNNLSSARSRIEDADYATEVSNMSRAQILQQAGTSVLAQANQVPQGVLSLLR